MLTELRVSNFALIDQLNLTVPAGFVSLTGETGAGKSLLIDAIGLLLGQRAVLEHIRTGAEESEIEASFLLPANSPLLAQLRQVDMLRADEQEVVVRRVLSRSGRSRNYFNGRLVSLHELERLAGALVDIHGQHDQQSLLNPAAQIHAIDQFGRIGPLRDRYVTAYGAWQDSVRQLEACRAEVATLREREDLLRYQAQEIADAAILPDEDVTLGERCRRLGHAERLRALSEEAYALLYSGDGAVLERVAQVGQVLKELAAIDSQSAPWSSALAQGTVLLEDVARELRSYREQVEDDPDVLGKLETRLARLEGLKKKYGGTLAAVVKKGAELDAVLQQLDGGKGREEALAAQAEEMRGAAGALATQLSLARREVIGRFESVIKKELNALHLAQARLTVRLEPLPESEDLGPLGRDRVQFLFSANSGEALQPLARVASGGEMSRVMLALKTVLAADDRVPVLIFDEIDAGVGGAAATAIGLRLRNLSRYHQVLCVTHLPQVAGQAQSQLQVEKVSQGKRTVTRVKPLDREARVEVLAKMLGGQAVTSAMRHAAAELLANAESEALKKG